VAAGTGDRGRLTTAVLGSSLGHRITCNGIRRPKDDVVADHFRRCSGTKLNIEMLRFTSMHDDRMMADMMARDVFLGHAVRLASSDPIAE